jgi:hypothetical protein
VTKAGKKEVADSAIFQVLEVDPSDYTEIKKKDRNNRKSRIIIPLDGKDDPEFIAFLKKENFVANNSFPIDIDSDDEEKDTMIIPSGNFKIRYNEVINKAPQTQSVKEEHPKV